jgi:hypothetical protein
MTQPPQKLYLLIETPPTLLLLREVGLKNHLRSKALTILYPPDLIYIGCATLSDLTHGLVHLVKSSLVDEPRKLSHPQDYQLLELYIKIAVISLLVDNSKTIQPRGAVITFPF